MTWTSGEYRRRNIFKEGAVAAIEAGRGRRTSKPARGAARQEPAGISEAEWERLRNRIVAALERFPEARRAVEDALSGDEA
jgi:hypothetical protein